MGPIAFRGMAVPEFRRKPIATCDFQGGGGPDPQHPHPSGSANERGNKVKQALVPKWTSAVLFTRHIGLCVIFDRACPGSEFVVANTLAKGAK